MTELDLVERSLAQARAKLSPSSADKDRTRRALGLPPKVLDRVGDALEQTPSAWESLRASGKLGAGLGGLVLATGVLIGFWLRGATDGQLDARPSSEAFSADHLQESAGLGTAAVVAHAQQSKPGSKDEQLLQGADRRPAAASSPLPPEAVKPNGDSATEPRLAEPRARTRTPSGGSAPRVFTATRFDEELALLQRVERAIRTQDSALALALLAELDEQFPETRLGEERQAARLIADCRLGGPNAMQRAQAFRHDRPSSVYSERIQAACALAPAAPAAAESLPVKNAESPDTHAR
jgi:hypothetical protein